MEAKIETITPTRARDLLTTLAPNRNIRPRSVRMYAEDMKAGRWKLTGDPIRISKDGEVIDGEHRLRAIAQADVAIDTLVVYGVDMDARVAIDTGARRTLADHLAFLGESDTNNTASALNVLWARHNDCIFTRKLVGSHQQLIDLLRQHPGIRDSVKLTRGVTRQVRLPRGLSAALHYDMSRLPDSAAAADTADFWERVKTGADMPVNHPVMQLRKRAAENAATVGRKVDQLTIHAWIIKAWNYYRAGTEIQALSWRRGGANPEPFPVLR